MEFPGTEEAIRVLREELSEDLYQAGHDLQNIDKYNSGWVRLGTKKVVCLTKVFKFGDRDAFEVKVFCTDRVWIKIRTL